MHRPELPAMTSRAGDVHCPVRVAAIPRYIVRTTWSPSRRTPNEEIDEQPCDGKRWRGECAGGRASVQERVHDSSARISRDGLLSGKRPLGWCSSDQPPGGNPAARRKVDKVDSAFKILECNVPSRSCCLTRISDGCLGTGARRCRHGCGSWRWRRSVGVSNERGAVKIADDVTK
jgi:hypothetical protein